jgi:DNA polymerase-3 subunit alpha
MAGFCHLHTHTEYSLLDGLCNIKDLVSHAKKLGQSSLAITDHGALFGIIDFYKECLSSDIKPIIGSEFYVTSKSMLDHSPKNSSYYHIILLAKNEVGLKNLYKLSTISYQDGFYYKPRIDKEILTKYSDGLICLSGCIMGEIAQNLLLGNYDGAINTANEYIKIFSKEDFYIELHNHNLADEKKILPTLIKLARELGINAVCANDIHYVKKEDASVQDILLCVQTQKQVTDTDRIKFETNEFYLKSYDEMLEAFDGNREFLDNTIKISDKCNVKIEFNRFSFPRFETENNTSPNEYLKELCYRGLALKYENITDDLKERLDYELNTIFEMGFCDYFLIVWDFVRFAIKNDIPVGPGRGSAAGSLVSYCLGITTVDPIKYHLVFERFLNKERISMPDIDIDFCNERRGEVIEYVINKYGSNRVAQIITFGTMKAKAAIKDVARAIGLPYFMADEVTKLIPYSLSATIDDALSRNDDLRKLYQADPKIKELIDISRKLEGHIRHSSIHAAGVLITGEDAQNLVPLTFITNTLATQFEMKNLEALGLLKMDFLGLRNLTVIKNTIIQIQSNFNININFDKMEFLDKNVFKMISQGETDGVFQLESRGMKSFLQEFKPQTLEDIIAGISLYRPGPMAKIPEFIKNKENPKLITYICPQLEKILSVTYGCIVYQEQVMEIFRELAGYSLGQADLIRRAISKKKASVLFAEKAKFIEGCHKNNISKEIAIAIFDEIEGFASYAFNKSHAAAYAVLAYQTAYLRHHYPSYFYAALITSYMYFTEKVAYYINSARDIGINVIPPRINESKDIFTVSGKSIVFGLNAIKGVGKSFSLAIVDEREQLGEFSSFENFIERLSNKQLNKKTLESLIKAGCFDEFGSRAEFLKIFEYILDKQSQEKKYNITGQIELFKISLNENISQYKDSSLKKYYEPTSDDLILEKEVLGLYVSGHPLKQFVSKINSMKTDFILDIKEKIISGEAIDVTKNITLVGVIEEIKHKRTKKGQDMAFLTLGDLTGSIECLVFPTLLLKCTNDLSKDNIIILEGKISLEENESIKLIANNIRSFSTDISNVKLYLKIENKLRFDMDVLKKTLKFFKGETPVYVYFSEDKRTTIADKSMWVSENALLLDKLKKMLGEDNVKLITD